MQRPSHSSITSSDDEELFYETRGSQDVVLTDDNNSIILRDSVHEEDEFYDARDSEYRRSLLSQQPSLMLPPRRNSGSDKMTNFTNSAQNSSGNNSINSRILVEAMMGQQSSEPPSPSTPASQASSITQIRDPNSSNNNSNNNLRAAAAGGGGNSNNSSYTNLKNFAGLSSAFTTPQRRLSNEDQLSQLGSVISSLSSHSHEQDSVLEPSASRHNSQETENNVYLQRLRDDVNEQALIDEDEHDQELQRIAQDRANNDQNNKIPSSATTPTPTFTSGNSPVPQQKMSSDDEKKVMFALFSLNHFVDETRDSTGRSSNSSNSSANPYFKETVRVVSTLPDPKTTVFKDRMRAVQNIKAHEGPIWTMKFSPNGHYLATGGQDSKVLVWAVGQLPRANVAKAERKSTPSEGDDNLGNGGGSYDDDEEVGLPGEDTLKRAAAFNRLSDVEVEESCSYDHFLHPEPYRVFEGHSGDIVDISWSRSNFILSASMDKAVRLWHVTRNDCLQFFRHPDIVTCVEFHPLHDRYFISGSFDRKLRVWDIIPSGAVREWTQASDTITSICFSPDGNLVVSGLIQGQIFFYEYDGLKYKTQMDCRNRSGQYKKGTKVTGMCFQVKKDYYKSLQQNADMISDHHLSNSSANNGMSFPRTRKMSTTIPPNLLVSTNDSRVRYCKLEDYSIMMKMKGLTNKSMQIKASFSDDGKYVVSGSEDGYVFIWKTNMEDPHKKFAVFSNAHETFKNGYTESFLGTRESAASVVAIFAPSEAIRHFVRTQESFLHSLEQLEPLESTSSTGKISPVPVEHVHKRGSNLVSEQLADVQDMSSRAVVTADTDGFIRVFFRLS